MKNKFVLAILIIGCISCQNQNNADDSLVTTGRDKNGCINSTGFKWSEIRNSCVQFYGEGIELIPLGKDEKSNIYVVYNDDSSKVELFIKKSENIVLNKNENKEYSNSTYRFNHNGLFTDNKLTHVAY